MRLGFDKQGRCTEQPYDDTEDRKAASGKSKNASTYPN
jgi:hypothetical protein